MFKVLLSSCKSRCLPGTHSGRGASSMPALLTSLRQGTGGSDRLDESCRDTLALG